MYKTNIFVFLLSFSGVQGGIKVMISGIAFDPFDCLSRLRALDCFKTYTIVPIVRIELDSIQAIEVVLIFRVVCDRPGSVSI